MESLEALVAHIQGLSGSLEEVAHLHSLLKQADGEPLRAHAAALVPFLVHLSPETHSLGYLYLLEACATSGPNLSDFGANFLVTIAGFLTACSADQICLAPDKFLNVCRVLKDQLMQLNIPVDMCFTVPSLIWWEGGVASPDLVGAVWTSPPTPTPIPSSNAPFRGAEDHTCTCCICIDFGRAKRLHIQESSVD